MSGDAMDAGAVCLTPGCHYSTSISFNRNDWPRRSTIGATITFPGALLDGVTSCVFPEWTEQRDEYLTKIDAVIHRHLEACAAEIGAMDRQIGGESTSHWSTVAATPSPPRADTSEMREACAMVAADRALAEQNDDFDRGWMAAVNSIEGGIRGLPLPDRPATDPGASPEVEEPALSEARAREVLASIWDDDQCPITADMIRRGENVHGSKFTLRAMLAFAERDKRDWTPHDGCGSPFGNSQVMVEIITKSGSCSVMENSAVHWRAGTYINEIPDSMPECCEVFFYRLAFARAAAQPQVPEGYVLVPKEPTEAMWRAGRFEHNTDGGPGDIWFAMLASAPSPVGERS